MRPGTIHALLLSLAALLVLPARSWPQQVTVPAWDHIVVVIEENQDATAVIGSPYFASLASRGMTLTGMHGITHPSQPNYIALFSGSVQGVTDNNRHDITAPNLATALAGAGLSFACYSEGLPVPGWRGWWWWRYVRRHNPAASFGNVPPASNLPFKSFPSDYALLPTVSFVIPDLANDMHNGTVAEGGAWLLANLDGYARWAVTHRSLFIVTFDECGGGKPVATTPIAAFLVGAGVRTGSSRREVNLYSLLRLIVEACGLGYLGEDRNAPAIEGFRG